jgi:hypothetical protein
MFFGNDDNNRGQQQPPQPAHEDDLRNEIQPPPPPDVTGAAVLHQPDLIQDVASKQGPGTKLRSGRPPICFNF